MQVQKLEKAIPEAIQKLNKIAPGSSLGAELKWCLESWRHDKNPVGLIEKTEAVLELLKQAKERNKRSVSAKLIADLEKGLN